MRRSSDLQSALVGMAGLEPARIAPTDFKSGASTDFATSPRYLCKRASTCETGLLGQGGDLGKCCLQGFVIYHRRSNNQLSCLFHLHIAQRDIKCGGNNNRRARNRKVIRYFVEEPKSG